MPNTIKTMIDPADAVMLLIDHQSGLFQLVKDIDMLRLRHNVSAVAKVSRLAKLPTFTTASVPDGPNGPLIPEIHRYNPEAIHIPRTGQINTWDNPKWVEAIQKKGRKTLLIAATLTSVCLSFPTLSALAAGYRVFTIIDASGNPAARPFAELERRSRVGSDSPTRIPLDSGRTPIRTLLPIARPKPNTRRLSKVSLERSDTSRLLVSQGAMSCHSLCQVSTSPISLHPRKAFL